MHVFLYSKEAGSKVSGHLRFATINISSVAQDCTPPLGMFVCYVILCCKHGLKPRRICSFRVLWKFKQLFRTSLDRLEV